MASLSAFLFTGANTFTLRSELLRWKKAFTQKYGEHNLSEYRGRDLTLSPLLDAVSSMPFLAEKRLVIVEGVPKVDRDEFLSVLQEMNEGTILAIIEPTLDKRLGLSKTLLDVCEIKSFEALSPRELRSWAQAYVQSLGSSMTQDTLQLLIDVLGDDQWVLQSELQKLCVFAGDRPITAHDIDLLAVPSGSQVVWTFTDLIGRGKQIDALRFLQRRLDRGEDAYGFWVILLNLVKNLVLVCSAVSEGLADERSIASATGLHFLAVRGLLPLARTVRQEKLQALLSMAVQTDISLKTGGLHATADHPHEIIAATEQLILQAA